jgi:RNA polymerase sigma-70 factor (ECF subfamily)
MEAQPSVLSFICAAIPRFHDAEDVLQETAVEAADHFDKYDDSRPFVAWAIGIARYKIAAFYRKHNRQTSLLSERVLEEVERVHVRLHPRHNARRVALEECLEQLPAKSRALIEARYRENLASEEMATRSGLSSGSVRVTLTRIRTKLLECVQSKLEQGGLA